MLLDATIQPLDIGIFKVIMQSDDYDNQTFHIQPDNIVNYESKISNG